jgi:hypothetical protein
MPISFRYSMNIGRALVWEGQIRLRYNIASMWVWMDQMGGLML